MTASEIALIGVAAFMAGAMNSVAGGGTFFSFPALLAVGVPSVMANASNAVALWPASLAGALASRDALYKYRDRLLPLSIVAFLGGLLGGVLLLKVQDRLFTQLIPWLLGVATLLFALSGSLSRLLARLRGTAGPSHGLGGTVFQFLVSVYGGFFGSGMGIVMIAALAIQGHTDLNEINALKNWLSAVIYSIAVVTFVIAGAVSWPHTWIMLITAVAGGYMGARLARRLPAVWLRRMVITIGCGPTVYYALPR
ncbi:sulfite exporter TauE/SafE family protein [Zoogloeaceae bacterium G21618-S1]|nr:sulfite exporter TauE/SafE family protein [Zoogloeaceae bacterium G21618-S1]